jgi:hypothetical protein
MRRPDLSRPFQLTFRYPMFLRYRCHPRLVLLVLLLRVPPLVPLEPLLGLVLPQALSSPQPESRRACSCPLTHQLRLRLVLHQLRLVLHQLRLVLLLQSPLVQLRLQFRLVPLQPDLLELRHRLSSPFPC